MKIISKQPQLATIFNAMGVLVDEATIEVESDKLRFRGMDPSHIAMLDIMYPQSAFETFEVESPLKMGVRVGEVGKVLKRFGKDELVGLGLTQDNSQLIVSHGENKFYNLRLIESSVSSTPLPKLNFNATIDVRYEVLKEILADIQAVSEYVGIEAKNGIAYFSGRGDSGDAMVTLSQQAVATIAVKEDSKATFSLDYLARMVKAVTAEDVKLEYSSKMPVKVSFDDGKIAFYLAPRVQD